jgi:hypothetical protein
MLINQGIMPYSPLGFSGKAALREGTQGEGSSFPDKASVASSTKNTLTPSEATQMVNRPVQHHVVYPQPRFRDSRLATVLSWGSMVGLLGGAFGAVTRFSGSGSRLASSLEGAGLGALAGGVLGGVMAMFQPRPEILAKRRYERENEVKLIPSAVSSGYEAIPVITVPGISSTVLQGNGSFFQGNEAIASGATQANTPLIITHQPYYGYGGYDGGYYPGYHHGMGDVLGEALMFSAVSNALTPNTNRGYSNSTVHHHYHPEAHVASSVPRYSRGANGMGVGSSNLKPSGSRPFRSSNRGSRGFGSSPTKRSK